MYKSKTENQKVCYSHLTSVSPYLLWVQIWKRSGREQDPEKKMFIFLMLSRREHWLDAITALGSQPTWEGTAVVTEKNSDNILEDFIQGKFRRKWRKNKLNENNNFRTKGMMYVWKVFNIPCKIIQNGKDHNVPGTAQ